jgi:multidrug transporter EmrE-like cation transporter
MTDYNEISKSSKLIIYAIILITLFEACAQLCFKKFDTTNTNSYCYLLFGLLLYTIVCALLCFCYKHKGHLGSVNLMWSCMSIIFVIIVGFVFLQEKLKLHDFFAIFFALLAIYFANFD